MSPLGVVAGRLHRDRCLLCPPGELLEGSLRPDGQAAFLSPRHHEPLRELVPELRREEQPALVVELRGVGAHEEHRAPPLRDPLTEPSSTAHHLTPLPSTVNHICRVVGAGFDEFAQVGGAIAVVEQNGGEKAPCRATATKP